MMVQLRRIIEEISITKIQAGTLPVRIETDRFVSRVVVGNHVLPGRSIIGPYPEQIGVIYVQLNNGQKEVLFSQSIETQVLSENSQYEYFTRTGEEEFSLWMDRGSMHGKTYWRQIVKPGLTYNLSSSFTKNFFYVRNDAVSYSDLLEMKEGDTLYLKEELSFARRSDGSRSNGEFTLQAYQSETDHIFYLPIEARFINEVDEQDWPVLLRYLEGRFVSEISLADFTDYSKSLREKDLTFKRESYTGAVTNGYLVFPRERPHGSAWRKHERIKFAQVISTENWPILLDLLIGKTFAGINVMSLKRDVSDTKRTRTQLKKAEDRFAAKVGQCFNAKNFTAISIGHRILLKGQNDQGEDLFVVDSPEHGVGFYLFRDAEAAKKWATGLIDFQEARQSAVLFTPHTGDWEDRIKEAVGF